MASIDSSKGNSKSAEEKFVVGVLTVRSLLVVGESSEPFAWLELGSSCFDFLSGTKEIGSGSSDLSLLQTNGRLWELFGISL